VLCKLTCVCALASAHTLNLFVYVLYIYSQACIYHVIDTFVYEPGCANSHMSVPLRVLTTRTWCQRKASQIEPRVLSVEVWSGSKCGVESKHFGNKRFYSGRLAHVFILESSAALFKGPAGFLIIFYLQCT